MLAHTPKSTPTVEGPLSNYKINKLFAVSKIQSLVEEIRISHEHKTSTNFNNFKLTRI